MYVTINTDDCIFTEGNILDNSKSTISVLNDLKTNRINTALHTMMLALGFEHGDSSVDVSQTLNFEEHLNSFSKIRKIVLQSCSVDKLSIMAANSNAKMKMKDSVKIWNLDKSVKAKPKQMLSKSLSELDKVALNIVYPPVRILGEYNPKLGETGLYYCNRPVMSSHNYPHKSSEDFCGPQFGPNCPACRTFTTVKMDKLNNFNKFQGPSGMVYCQSKIDKPSSICSQIWSPFIKTPCNNWLKSIWFNKVEEVDDFTRWSSFWSIF